MSDLSSLAERALGAVRYADSAQARVVRERSLMLRFARSRPTQATSIEDTETQIAVVVEGHIGLAETNRADRESLVACARAAGAAAQAAARGGAGAFPGFPSPAALGEHAGHDPETARLDAGTGGQALRTAFGHGDQAHGVWTAGEVRTALASSEGMLAEDAVTDAFMKVICFGRSGRSGYAADTASAVRDLDPDSLAAAAAAKAAASGDPKPLPPGEYPVVLERHAVGQLLSWLGFLAFNGLAYAEGRSALAGKLGSQLVAPEIELTDAAQAASTLPRAFDAEGVPKGERALVEGGVARGVVHDTRTAALVGDGATSTGHALLPGGSSYGPTPTNLVLAGGDAAGEAELCRGIERGVYVTRLWYLNPVRPRETLVTGVTRDGTFLIEDGEIAGPLADLRFSDSILDVLASLQALGRDARLTSDGEFYGRRFASGVVCPPARVGAMRFTGGAGRD